MSKVTKKTPAPKARDPKAFYDPYAISLKWQAKWGLERIYQPDLKTAKKPFYNLMMFPYPSAEGLHIGSIFTFGGVDVYGRFKRMQGFDVFEPIGLDGFGINAENHALKTGDHPIEHAKRTESNFYRQLRDTGNAFAWDYKVETYNSNYYRWTQWLFIELFKAGLAYKKTAPVNFCPSCKTVLADEQVIDGKCERCGSVVEKNDLSQWFFRITKYADRLLDNIKDLNWSERVKVVQKNWIGRSEGVRIEFKIQNSKRKIEAFTTAIDTVYGVTFLVVSPEHPLVAQALQDMPEGSQKTKLEEYIKLSINKSEQERLAEGKEKTGVPSGLYALHPFTGEKIPVWVADYVLSGYGTGAVMGVPGHDARDHEFAKKFAIPVTIVVKPAEDAHGATVEKDGFWDYKEIKTTYKDKSVLINSGEFDGLSSKEAKAKLAQQLKERGIGERTSTYHLRDWLISRQRYWGPPIPMIYCEACGKKGDSWFTKNRHSGEDEGRLQNPDSGQARMTTEDNSHVAGWYPAETLPIELPYVEDYKPMGTGKSPLANYPDFYTTTCPGCGGEATRETDVSDTFLDSSWYFMRYPSANVSDKPFDPELTKKWLPVTMYIGGAEHSVLHLLYARFVTMVLHDLGHLTFEEPFARFYAHGLIIKDGAKMSKSKGNVINPDEYIAKYGADAVRCYLLFLGPFNQGGDFRDTGMEGMFKFIKRVWTMFIGQTIVSTDDDPAAKSLRNKTIKEVTEEMEGLRFNTSIARLMSYYNFLSAQKELARADAETFLKLLAPFAPYTTEELWQRLQESRVPHVAQVPRGQEARDTRDTSATLDTFNSIHTSSWPVCDESAIVEETVTIAIQVNGKLRGTLAVAKESVSDNAAIEQQAKSDEHVKKFLSGKTIKKFIYVPGRIINFVV